MEADGAVEFDFTEAHTSTGNVVLHFDAADYLTFTGGVLTNPRYGNDAGIDTLTVDCLFSGMTITATAYESA